MLLVSRITRAYQLSYRHAVVILLIDFYSLHSLFQVLFSTLRSVSRLFKTCLQLTSRKFDREIDSTYEDVILYL